MLQTPLGLLYVYINNEQVKYNISELPLKPIEISNYKVDARYMIEIDKSQVKSGDIITFMIDTNIIAEVDGGDCLVEAMFESDDLYLAIGGYDINYHKSQSNSAYSFSVIKNGLEAEIIDLQYIDDFRVAIAWSDTNKEDYYTAVWFAADPYI
ncbi:hypothetical protein [Terrisporobacter mayombei]|uniref:Uncharacterized protein n=1 Tax=Terrisporobacter mayombei TaxID=1541 RepID=A0ABY9PZ26_9FIRM|nr:hypothetical protein [Terrisporobacter mayombei]MCC3868293.1 hypothetical protein [Terrisporobacter mayombei]WMT80434.1 hypothetical protein TEMA_07510 [Terrisporobacter mayombei]